MMNFVIYVLKHPETNEIRWVGQTGNARQRWLGHKHAAKRLIQGKLDRESNTHLYYWWNKCLRETGLCPAISIVATVPSREAADAEEIRWIKDLRASGVRLINIHVGGHYAPPSLETRQKISLANKGRIIDDDWRRNMSEAHKGILMGPMSDAHKKALSQAKKGSVISYDHRCKISETLKGRVPWNKGIPASEETRRRMSASHKGKAPVTAGIPMTDITKAKIRTTLQGRPHSPDTRAKQSAGLRQWWANRRDNHAIDNDPHLLTQIPDN
jgi:hypothetical protein